MRMKLGVCTRQSHEREIDGNLEAVQVELEVGVFKRERARAEFTPFASF